MLYKRKLIYILFALFVFLLMMVPIFSVVLLPKGKAVYHFVVAQKLLKEGNADGALIQVQKGVKIQPQSLMGLRAAANIYMINGRYDEAEIALAQLMAMSEHANTYRDLGLVRLYKGDREGALEAARKAISLAPDSANNYHLLGAIALDEKDNETAQKHLRKAIELDPKNTSSRYLLGMVYFEQERLEEAADELSLVIHDEPRFASAHSLIGMCYLKMNLNLHALSAFKRAAALDPTDYNSMYNVACVYALENQPQPALKWLESAIENGFTDFEHMRSDSDLDNIRNLPEFAQLLDRDGPDEAPKAEPQEVAEVGAS